MTASTQVRGEVSGQGRNVYGDHDAARALRPTRQVWIGRAARQVGTIADADRVDRKCSGLVVSLNRLPRHTAQVLVEDVLKRHPSRGLLFDLLETAAQLRKRGIRVRSGRLATDLLLHGGNMRVHLGTVLEVKRDRLVNQRQR